METPSRLFDFIYYQQAHFPQKKAFGAKVSGSWQFLSTAQTIEAANGLSRGLIRLGIQPGDKIAITVSQNRPEWVIADIAIQQVGAINVPVYPTISAGKVAYIFNEAEVKLCFADTEELHQKIAGVQAQIPSLQEIYLFDPLTGVPFWKSLFREEGQAEVESRKASIRAEDLATIIYTSGTTGEPKGVMLSHSNITSAVYATLPDVQLNPGDRTLSFLPLCHIFERTGNYFQTYRSCNVHFAGVHNLGGADGDMQAVKPHFFNTVPRLLEKVYETICNTSQQLTGDARKLFDMAMALTETYDYDMELTEAEKAGWALADQHIFSKWREALGGSVRGIICGAAPISRRILQVFRSAGIELREGYGLTETSPGLCLGRKGKGAAVLGAIGPAISGVDLMIDASDGRYAEGEGEILAHGPNVMLGYYKKPKETAEAFREINGKHWFRTGDIGHFVEAPNGSKLLKITDRKKELLKTSGGKYVAPAPIEGQLKENFLIEHAMVVGDQQKFVSALIVPAEESLQHWCRNKGIPWYSLAEAILHPDVLGHFQALVEKVNEELSRIEKIKKFRLLAANWSPIQTNGSSAELTPTLKLKRRVILDKYQADIEALYIER